MKGVLTLVNPSAFKYVNKEFKFAQMIISMVAVTRMSCEETKSHSRDECNYLTSYVFELLRQETKSHSRDECNYLTSYVFELLRQVLIRKTLRVFFQQQKTLKTL
ncbi:unnamed protein product [Lupinus luteus]|uniref:Uncharacterized protein n=1 Tax=Lupinus luteus TaxID=3873 RepID=A0AAV1W817_LUPLU